MPGNLALRGLGAEHAEWFDKLSRRTQIHEEPLTNAGGSILAEPLPWVEYGGIRRACFGRERSSTAVENRLVDEYVAILEPGDECWEED